MIQFQKYVSAYEENKPVKTYLIDAEVFNNGCDFELRELISEAGLFPANNPAEKSEIVIWVNANNVDDVALSLAELALTDRDVDLIVLDFDSKGKVDDSSILAVQQGFYVSPLLYRNKVVVDSLTATVSSQEENISFAARLVRKLEKVLKLSISNGRKKLTCESLLDPAEPFTRYNNIEIENIEDLSNRDLTKLCLSGFKFLDTASIEKRLDVADLSSVKRANESLKSVNKTMLFL